MCSGRSCSWLSSSAAWGLLALRRPPGSSMARLCCWGGLWLLFPGRAGVALCCWPVRRQSPASGRGLPSGAEGGQPRVPTVLARFPPAAPDCARQNCRCQALHRKSTRREGEETQRSSGAARFKLTFCFVGVQREVPPAPAVAQAMDLEPAWLEAARRRYCGHKRGVTPWQCWDEGMAGAQCGTGSGPAGPLGLVGLTTNPGCCS